MENKKRAIVLDMDETLEHGIFKRVITSERGSMMVARPGLDELIKKLQEAKKQGIDVILCTTAKGPWVERFLTLKPELRDVFDKVYTADNREEWDNITEEKYPIEYKARRERTDMKLLKPVTTFGYDSVVFIDDITANKERLQKLYSVAAGKLDKDVTHFTGFSFSAGMGMMDLLDVYRARKAAEMRPNIAELYKRYIECERDNPGCRMMCTVIDKFMAKEFVPGLTFEDENYLPEYEEYYSGLDRMCMELDDAVLELEDELGVNLTDDCFEEAIQFFEGYMSTDKKYTHEGLDVSREERNIEDKRMELEGLISEAAHAERTMTAINGVIADNTKENKGLGEK